MKRQKCEEKTCGRERWAMTQTVRRVFCKPCNAQRAARKLAPK